MSNKMVWTCDRCLKEVRENDVCKVKLNVDADLCPICYEIFSDMISGFWTIIDEEEVDND